MVVFKYIFWILYRIWFYILVAIPIILLFPVLIIVISKEKWYPHFFKLARFWATFILFGMGFRPIICREQNTEPRKSYMFIANHTSMADIMLMLYAVKNPFVFVGKQELAKIPLFGFFYKRTCILVDRSDAKSRQAVFKSAQKRLSQGLSVCIFPEGGVPDEHVILDEFKDGAFRLAINHKIPIVPLVFPDNKKRFSFSFFSGSPGVMRVKQNEFLSTKDFDSKESSVLRETARKVILNELLNFENKKPLGT